MIKEKWKFIILRVDYYIGQLKGYFYDLRCENF